MCEPPETEPSEPTSAKPGQVLDYRTPTTASGGWQQPLVGDSLAIFATLFAFATFISFALAGVSSDHITLPRSTKIVLTAASVSAVAVIQLSTIRRPRGCTTIATLYALAIAVELAVMWYWN